MFKVKMLKNEGAVQNSTNFRVHFLLNKITFYLVTILGFCTDSHPLNLVFCHFIAENKAV